MTRWWTALGICWAVATAPGCGDVASADAPGDALYAVPGRLLTGAFGEPEGAYRSVLGWLSFGGGAFVECLESDTPIACAPATAEYEATLSFEPAALIPEFPSRFTLEVVALPQPQETLTYKGSVLAMGGVAIYDDRNRNGALDLAEEVGPGLADRLVAESAVTDTVSAIVFREGPVHPIWKVLRAFGCDDPPIGFSMVVRPTSFQCKVEPIADLVLTPTTAEATARAVCALQSGTLWPTAVEFPPFDMGLPDEAVVTCDATGESLTYYVDRGNVCDQYLGTTLALSGCPVESGLGERCWDLSEAPPAWWPCVRE